MKKVANKSVDISNLSVQMLLAWDVVDSVFEGIAGKDAIVTCGREGNHSAPWMHFQGQALDFRTIELTSGQRDRAQVMISSALGIDYDVILEATHLHIEYQPKYKGE